MSYCPQCGTQIPESANSCPKCGLAHTNTETGFDYHYYEKKRLEKIESSSKYVKRSNIGIIISIVIFIFGLSYSNDGVMGIIFFVFLSFASAGLFITCTLSRSAYNKIVRKWSNMTAHDLYMEEKKDAQDMANLANGLKAVNTGMKIGQFLGGL